MEAIAHYHDLLAEASMVKRFYERWIADGPFRSAVAADPAATLERYGMDIRPEDIASLIDPTIAAPSPGVRKMWTLAMDKMVASAAFYQDEHVPDNPRWQIWRERQIKRQVLDVGPFHASTNIHAPYAVELSKGCSVGCWFCAVDAKRFGGHWQYTEENAAFWQGMLRVLEARLGPGAAAGFLYWATEPLDNPDYERFCLDFATILGEFPPTTTALALKDPDRTRNLIRMSEEYGCWQNRFSVVSLKLLDRVHAEFSAEELARVECLPLTRDASFSFGNAGRFRERVQKNPELLEIQREKLSKYAPWYRDNPDYQESEDYPMNTIGCVTGFLFNMVDRTVQLISPCTATDEWPLGFYVYGEGSWNSLDELASVIDALVERHMPSAVRHDDALTFHEWLKIEPVDDGVRLRGRYNQVADIAEPGYGDAIRMTADLVREKTIAADLLRSVSQASSVSETLVQQWLDDFLAAGVLAEETR